MRSLKFAAFAAFFSSLVLLAGCATQSADQAAASFSATAGRICTVIQPTFSAVNTEAAILNPPLSEADQAKLKTASADVDTFCQAPAAATSETAQGLLNAMFPAVMSVVANSSLNDSSRNALLLSLVGVQTAANVLLSQASGSPSAMATSAQ